jgi:hypothetical protein
MLSMSNILKASAVAGVLSLGAYVLAAPAPASAATYMTHCDRFGTDCYRVRCDDEGDNCVRIYDYDRNVERTAYRHWFCDEGGCRWTYDYTYSRPRYDYDYDYNY